MASITSAGIGSGLDVATLVSQLVAIERRPLQNMQKAATQLQTQLSSMGKIQSYLASLKDTASVLATSGTWRQVSATSANSAAVQATAAEGATKGTYAVQVNTLAAQQNVATATAYTDSTSTLGAGTLLIELGSYTYDTATPPAVTGWTAKAGATPVTVTIAADQTSLSSIRDQINAANAGVTAGLVNDASGTRLTLRSNDTGAVNAFRITATESGGAGLSALAFNPAPAGTSAMSWTQKAANATATVNGLSVSSATNTLSGVVDNLSLQLNQVTTSAVNVSVSQDDAAMTRSVKAFVDAYNTLSSYLTSQTKYDATTKTAGPLQGDTTVVGMLNELRRLVGNSGTASSTYARLSDAGLQMQRDGTLQVNSTKLTASLINLDELKKFFTAIGSEQGNQGSDGFGRRFKALADAYISTNGVLVSRTQGLNKRIASNAADQERFNARVDLFQARLTAQYNQLDKTMAQLNGTGNYVSSYLSGLNRSS